MPTADRIDDKIVLRTEFRDRDLIRAVSGARYDRDEQVWTVPLSWANCLCLRGVFGERLEVGQDLESWAWAELAERVRPAQEAAMRAMDVDADCEGDPRAYSYQRTAVEFLTFAGSACIGDEMGCGKTVEMLLALEAQEAYPALIIAPNAVMPVWADHFRRWLPDRKVSMVAGGAVGRRKALEAEADVYIISWGSLRLNSRLAPYGNIRLADKEKEPKELNRPWAAVVADEAHRCKDPKSKSTRALWAIGASAEHRYALTGTPVAQDPGDFWSIMHFVSPLEWPSRSKYVERYCLTAWNGFGGLDIVGVHPHVRDEFFAVVDSRFLRRTKDQVLPHLPPKVYERRLVTMGKKQADAYKALADDMVVELDSGTLMTFSPLTQWGRLSQAASAYLELDEAGDVTLTDPSCKIDALEELLKTELRGQPIVVFAASRKLIELAARRLAKMHVTYGLVTGGQNGGERAATVEKFQRGELGAILLTMGAGAEGLTLTRARTLVFLQRSYSLVENKQAEDRIHRPGAEQHDSLLIIDLVTEGTVEERVVDVLSEKAGMADEITRDSLRSIIR